MTDWRKFRSRVRFEFAELIRGLGYPGFDGKWNAD